MSNYSVGLSLQLLFFNSTSQFCEAIHHCKILIMRDTCANSNKVLYLTSKGVNFFQS